MDKRKQMLLAGVSVPLVLIVIVVIAYLATRNTKEDGHARGVFDAKAGGCICPASTDVVPPLGIAASPLAGGLAAGHAAEEQNIDCTALSTAYFDDLMSRAVQERLGNNGKSMIHFTIPSLMNLHPCARGSTRYHVHRDVVFPMMAGSVNINRARAFRTTWGRNIPADNVVVMGDEVDESVGMITLPELRGKKSYDDAQNRSLKALTYTMSNPKYDKFEWVFMVDDDTWVNTRALPGLLYGWDTRLPFMFAFVWHDPVGLKGDTIPSGGAGMLMTRAAAKKLAAALFTPLCPAPAGAPNDKIIGECVRKLGIGLVHTNLLDPFATVAGEMQATFGWVDNHGDMRSMVTVHKAEPDRMCAYQCVIDKYNLDNSISDGYGYWSDTHMPQSA